MKLPDKLAQVWQDRAVEEPAGWFVKHYNEAVERIEDRTDDPRNPYYYGPEFDGSGFQGLDGPIINDEFSELKPDDARKIAFEMLALADLAEIAPLPDQGEQSTPKDQR